MGKNRKSYSETFKQKVVREAFTSGSDAKDIAAKYEIAPSTLSEWKKEALSGKDSKRVKELEKRLAEMEAERETMLTALGKKDLIIELLKKKNAILDGEKS